jgi:hypothetical protein
VRVLLLKDHFAVADDRCAVMPPDRSERGGLCVGLRATSATPRNRGVVSMLTFRLQRTASTGSGRGRLRELRAV